MWSVLDVYAGLYGATEQDVEVLDVPTWRPSKDPKKKVRTCGEEQEHTQW